MNGNNGENSTEKTRKELATQASIEEQKARKRFCDAVSRRKSLTEYEIGFTSFDWNFVLASFEGEIRQPEKFFVFDEVVFELLLAEQMSLIQLARILGLDIESNSAERNLLENEIEELTAAEMLESAKSDNEILRLTDAGKEYAQHGEKIKTYSKKFELYFDDVFAFKDEGKKVFPFLRAKETTNLKEESKLFKKDDMTDGFLNDAKLECVKAVAEYQARDVHFPKNRFYLLKCKIQEEKHFSAILKVALLENFKDNTNRVLVYDEKNDEIIDSLSKAFSSNKQKMEEVLNKIKQESENSVFPIETVPENEEKSDEQKKREKEQIEKQEEFDAALKLNDSEKTKEISIREQNEKSHFSTLEFEAELEKIFKKYSGEIWLECAWVKQAAQNLIPMFKSFLEHGGSLFIAYSASERDNNVMCFSQVFDELLELEKQNSRFFLCELNPFHNKWLWVLENGKGIWYYTGSYNILSFHSNSRNPQKVRRESMDKIAWNNEHDELYMEEFVSFALKYLKETEKKFDSFCEEGSAQLCKSFFKEAEDFKIGKLNFFLNKNAQDVDSEYEKWVLRKNEKLAELKSKFCRQQILEIQAEFFEEENEKNASKQPVDSQKTSEVEKKLRELCADFPEAENLEEKRNLEKCLRELRERRECYCKSQLSELLKEAENIAKNGGGKREFAGIESRLKKICTDFPEAAMFDEKAEIELLFDRYSANVVMEKLKNLLIEAKSVGSESIQRAKIKEFKNRLNAIEKEFPETETLEEKSKIVSLLDSLSLKCAENELSALENEAKSQGDALVSPEKFNVFQKRLDEICDCFPEAKNAEKALGTGLLIEQMRERYYKDALCAMLKEIKSFAQNAIPLEKARKIKQNADNIIERCPQAENWNETKGNL